jgi:phage terminase large subunit-like protein
MTLNSSLPSPSSDRALLTALEREQLRRQSFRKLTDYRPYAKQRAFHAAGKDHRERLLMAGNQLGKTLSAGAETAMHLTGRYPDWWDGHVKTKPFHAWVSGVTGESTRDNPQRILYGPIGSVGTGMIPKDAIIDTSPRRGLADAVDTMIIRFGGGADVQQGQCILGFKSYDQGREKWQGPTLGLVWYDEEPPEDIYSEGMTRTNVGLCPVYITFTPLKGMSEVVRRFYPLAQASPGTHVTMMGIEDAEHYSPEERAAIIASYPKHERDARTKGLPQLGSGRVFPIDEDEIKCAAFNIPAHWPQIGGLDFGWDHPSAGVKLAWDRDADCVYVIAAHRQREQTPAMFAAAVKPWGAHPDGSQWLPWSWPHDGLQHDKGSGEQLAAQYRSQGLRMLPMRATFEDGSFGVEAGIAQMLDRMQSSRFKVFSHLEDWFEEFRLYHRKDGLIVKKGDDLISASRYALMMARNAIVKTKVATTNAKPQGRATAGGWMG